MCTTVDSLTYVPEIVVLLLSFICMSTDLCSRNRSLLLSFICMCTIVDSPTYVPDIVILLLSLICMCTIVDSLTYRHTFLVLF